MEALRIIFIVSLTLSLLLIGATLLVIGLKNKKKSVKRTLLITFGSILLGIAFLIIYFYMSHIVEDYINSKIPRIRIPIDGGIDV